MSDPSQESVSEEIDRLRNTLRQARLLLTELLPYARRLRERPADWCGDPACVRCAPEKAYVQLLETTKSFLQSSSD